MNILFVCTGNTCRSPMAEGYLKSLEIPNTAVLSRGLFCDGSPASENAVKVMAEIGIDISSHISETVTEEDLDWADRVVCMSRSHMGVLYPCAGDKISLLGNGIPDPFGADADGYREARDSIIKAIDSDFKPFNVRLIEKSDIKKIAKLEKICFSAPWSEEGILESFLHGTVFYVCEKGKSLLGYMGISSVLDEGYITNIAVFPEHRRKGVATALLKRCFCDAQNNGLSFVSLEVRESNFNAVSLYEKMGFKKEGVRKNFYSEPKEDALIMTKRFEKNEDTCN